MTATAPDWMPTLPQRAEVGDGAGAAGQARFAIGRPGFVVGRVDRGRDQGRRGRHVVERGEEDLRVVGRLGLEAGGG